MFILVPIPNHKSPRTDSTYSIGNESEERRKTGESKIGSRWTIYTKLKRKGGERGKGGKGEQQISNNTRISNYSKRPHTINGETDRFNNERSVKKRKKKKKREVYRRVCGPWGYRTWQGLRDRQGSWTWGRGWDRTSNRRRGPRGRWWVCGWRNWGCSIRIRRPFNPADGELRK